VDSEIQAAVMEKKLKDAGKIPAETVTKPGLAEA
jgi:hypothetical protein